MDFFEASELLYKVFKGMSVRIWGYGERGNDKFYIKKNPYYDGVWLYMPKDVYTEEELVEIVTETMNLLNR